MSYLQAVVYDPPSGDYPPVIIIFKSDGGILAACAASSHEEAENFLADVEAKVEATRHIERSSKIC